MDFYQTIVTDYLRADRSMFLNTQCCIQLNPGPNPDTSGPHWYCDAIAVDFRSSKIFLCEISYSRSLYSLLKRIDGWRANWNGICAAIARDCMVPNNYPVHPWVFVPAKQTPLLERQWAAAPTGIGASGGEMPVPLITELESVVPWNYRSWDRIGEIAAARANGND